MGPYYGACRLFSRHSTAHSHIRQHRHWPGECPTRACLALQLVAIRIFSVSIVADELADPCSVATEKKQKKGRLPSPFLDQLHRDFLEIHV